MGRAVSLATDTTRRVERIGGIARRTCPQTGRILVAWVTAPEPSVKPRPPLLAVVALWLGVFAGLSLFLFSLLWLAWHVAIAANRAT